MKILLACPSKNRYEILEKYTYRWLKLMNFDWKIFVEPQDFGVYAVAGITNLVTIEKDNQGLGYAKQFIKNYAKENGYDLVFKIDDDIRCFTDYRKKTEDTETANLLNEFIKSQVIPSFEKHANLGAIAFPYSFHMFEKQGWYPAKKLQTCYIVRTPFFTNDKYNFTVFEDFAVGLDLLVNGYKILKYGLLGQDMGVQVGGGTGGHQDFLRAQNAKNDAELLRKLYPPIAFKKVDKPWEIEPDMRSVKL